MKYAIGIDLGGTAIKCALIDQEGNFLFEDLFPTRAQESSDAIIEQLILAITTVNEFASSKNYPVAGIGLGSPGIIDNTRGTILGGAENLKDWINIPLVDILSSETGLPVYIDNDANLMGLAEASFGAAKGCSDVIFLTIGTGIGGAMVINNKLYGGFRNRGGELGHFPLISNGEKCACGSRGCFEHYASATGLIRRYKERLDKNSKLYDADCIDGRYIIGKYKEGEPEAIESLNENSDFIGHAIAGFINIFSPQKVVIGGGLADSGSFYLDKIRYCVQEYAMAEATVNTSIELAALGNTAGTLGAASLVFNA